MKFTFTGKDGSCGFRTGCTYELATSIEKRRGWLFVSDIKNRSCSCPYSTLEAFLDNWKPE